MAILQVLRRLCPILLLCACATTGTENVMLQAGRSNPERRSALPAAPDRPVILMAFSGGGARASALAAAVLAEMKAEHYAASDGTHELTDDVALVSSVSGGSVTAAWFGLNRAKNLDELKSRFLTLNNMGSIEGNLVNPVFWLREAFTPYSRIDALEDLLRTRLFQDARLADINKPGHPFVIFNASDMAGGESFAMTPARFDDICSDYDALPVATAVAASAAFPVALTPVNLRDFQPNCPGTLLHNAGWAQAELNQAQGQVNLAEFRNARYTNDLRHGDHPFRDIQYLHLLDGGLADNLGVGALRTALSSPFDDTGLAAAIVTGKVRRLVVIVVNARSDPPSKLYGQANASGIVSQLNAVTSVPIDANSQNGQQALDDMLLEYARNSGKQLQVYNVDVDFDLMAADTDEHRALRDAAKAIPTSWNIDGNQLAIVDRAAHALLAGDACYQALLQDVGAGPAGALPAGLPCKTRIRH